MRWLFACAKMRVGFGLCFRQWSINNHHAAIDQLAFVPMGTVAQVGLGGVLVNAEGWCLGLVVGSAFAAASFAMAALWIWHSGYILIVS